MMTPYGEAKQALERARAELIDIEGEIDELRSRRSWAEEEVIKCELQLKKAERNDKDTAFFPPQLLSDGLTGAEDTFLLRVRDEGLRNAQEEKRLREILQNHANCESRVAA